MKESSVCTKASPGHSPRFHGERIALSTLLARLGHEVGRLEGLASDLDSMFGKTQALASALEGEAGQSLQRLDLLRQSLGCLSAFLDALAVDSPADIELCTATARHTITLGDLAAALMEGRNGLDPAAQAQGDSSDVEFL